MKYKLKEGKTLTKEDLINTKWEFGFDLMSKKEIFFNRFIINLKLDLSVYNMVSYYSIVHKKSHLISEIRTKEMNFDDWFEEDNNPLLEQLMSEKDDPIWEAPKSFEESIVKEGPKECSFMWAYEQKKQGNNIVWINNLKEVHKTYWNDDYEKMYWDSEWTNPVTLNRNTLDGWEIFEENKFKGHFFEFNVSDGGYINQIRMSDNIIHDHQWQKKDIEAFEEAIKRSREMPSQEDIVGTNRFELGEI